MSCTSHTEDFVKDLYHRMCILKPQQLDFREMAKHLGIQSFYWPDKSQALFLRNHAYIFLNEQLTTQQQWQDFCHELAHILLHSGHQGRMSPLFRTYQENKANNFMYHACVPTFMLKSIELDLLSPQFIASTFNVELDFAEKRFKHFLHNHVQHMPIWNT